MRKIKLDFTLSDPKDRLALVNEILEQVPNPSESYLETLADYLIIGIEKAEKEVLTANRNATIKERETSFEGLQSKFEGEDTIYNIFQPDNKTILLKPKQKITQQDIEDIPALAQLREGIDEWERALRKAEGRDAYLIKRSLIEMRKDQYAIKNAYKPRVGSAPFPVSGIKIIELPSREYLNEKNALRYEGLSFCDPDVVRAVLVNYSDIKEAGYSNFLDDFWYFMEDFDALANEALKDFPLYERLVELKIDGKSSIEIKDILEQEYEVFHGLGYYSTVWSKKIPLIIARKAQEKRIKWFYEQNPDSEYKVCSKCGERLPANLFFFSRNKDGYYSKCKKCRRKQRNEVKKRAQTRRI